MLEFKGKKAPFLISEDEPNVTVLFFFCPENSAEEGEGVRVLWEFHRGRQDKGVGGREGFFGKLIC